MLISNKLISLLATFSKHDLNHFKKYLASPFFNENSAIEKLYAIIFGYLKTANKKEEKLIEKENIWTIIYPNKKYNDIKMRRLSSDLIKHTFSFLAYKNYKEGYSSGTNFFVKSFK